jgi:hypothetical protein
MQVREAQFLITDSLARRWQISPRTLERWRYQGTGPAWTKIGGRVLYELSLIKAYEALGCVDPATRVRESRKRNHFRR